MMYSIDTSALLDGYNRLYPPDVFSKLWEHMGQLVKDGSLQATEMVLEELKRKDDDALKWAKDHQLFIPVDENIQKIVGTIMGKYPRIVAEGGQKNMADPFVVAFAKQRNLTVITAENKIGSEKKPTIPFLCKEFNIRCIVY